MPLVTVNDYIEAKLTHSVHTSERRSFRGCRRRHDWLFRHFYYPLTTAKPLEFGVAYHKAMEMYYHPDFWGRPRDAILELAIQTFRIQCQQQFHAYVDTLGEGAVVNDEVREDYDERKELGESMLRYFHEHASQDPVLQHLRPIKVEIAFEIPIDDGPGGQLWCKCKVCWDRFKAYAQLHQDETYDTTSAASRRRSLLQLSHAVDDAFGRSWWDDWKGLPVTYGGRIDAIFEDQAGRIWIFDWKTAARLAAEQDREEFLALDDQILSYCASLWKLGIKVEGFIYFEQKKAVPTEPEPHASGRRYKGRLFSTNRQMPYQYEVYQRTVEELDPEAFQEGLYDEYLEYLKLEGPEFHHWYREYRTPEQMQICLEDIYNEASDITDPNLRIYKNAGRFNCGNCAFRQPCLEKSGGGDYVYALETMFEKRRYHYWESKEPSTDSKGGE